MKKRRRGRESGRRRASSSANLINVRTKEICRPLAMMEIHITALMLFFSLLFILYITLYTPVVFNF